MISLFTGMPGAGKTAALVDLLSKLTGDRPLFVDGLNGLKIDHTPCDAHNWHEELPDGAILVIDEVQRVWRPRGPGSKVPADVAALETHRHRGIDIYVTTQAPRLLDANVRGLVGRHVHIRDTGWLGRHWYEWPEVNDAMTWKTCPVKKKYTLPRKAFDLYTSASVHTKPVRMTPMALYFSIAIIIAAFLLAFMVYRTVASKTEAKPEAAKSATATQSVNASSSVGRSSAVGRSVDDRVDFIPRVSSKPESAPAYDHLRQVVVMPVVVGGYCMPENCVCITHQGTDPGLSQAECRAWIEGRPFNPYILRHVEPSGGVGTPSGYTQSPSGHAALPAASALASASPFGV